MKRTKMILNNLLPAKGANITIIPAKFGKNLVNSLGGDVI